MNPNEIRHFNGYNPSLEKPRDVLQVGGYICKIIKAKAQDLPDGNQELDLMLKSLKVPTPDSFTEITIPRIVPTRLVIVASTRWSVPRTTFVRKTPGGWTSSTSPSGRSLPAIRDTNGTGTHLLWRVCRLGSPFVKTSTGESSAPRSAS